MIKITAKINLYHATEYQKEYAALRKALMNAAAAACRRNHGGPNSDAYDVVAKAAIRKINDTWPEGQAWYVEKGIVYPAWIAPATGENLIQQDIKWWNEE